MVFLVMTLVFIAYRVVGVKTSSMEMEKKQNIVHFSVCFLQNNC